MNLPPLSLVDGALLIDNSMLEGLTTCPRSTEYSFLHKRKAAEERPALNFGGSIHAALAHRYKQDSEGIDAKTEQEQVKLLEDWYAEKPNPEEDFRNLDKAVSVISNYNREYMIEPFIPLEMEKGKCVEQSFAFHIFDVESKVYGKVRIIYTGRIDLVVEWEHQIFTVDHKTTSIMGNQFFEELSMSPQQMGYAWALSKSIGKAPTGYMINAICCRRPTKTGVGIEFARNRYYLSQEQIDEWKHNLQALVEEFVWNYDRDYMPQKKKWCVGKYGKCPYFDVCSLPVMQRGLMLDSGMYEDNKWSPLNV